MGGGTEVRTDAGSLELALSRLQARHGDRPDDAGWRRLETVRALRPWLDAARGTALRPWLVGITADDDARAAETLLRQHWRAHLDEIARWLPPAWLPAWHWCALLPDLPALQHLARGEPAPAWMHEDPRWQALASGGPRPGPGLDAVDREPGWAPFVAAWQRPDEFGAIWLAQWQARWPGGSGADPVDPQDRSPLQQLQSCLHEHRAAFAGAGSGQGALLRQALQARLTVLLRRAALDPAVVFIHLAFDALELERLRSGLMRRLLFAPAEVA